MSGLGGGLRATNTNTSAHTARIACRAAKESAASGTSRGRPSVRPHAANGRSGSLPTRHALPLLCARIFISSLLLLHRDRERWADELCALHMTWHFFNLFMDVPCWARISCRWLWCWESDRPSDRPPRCVWIFMFGCIMRNCFPQPFGAGLLCAVCQKVSILLLASCRAAQFFIFCTATFQEKTTKGALQTLGGSEMDRWKDYNWFSS